jgi:hypothetical protein
MAKLYDIVNTSKMSMEYDGSLIDVTKRAKTALENGRLVAIDADGTIRYAITGDSKVYLHASVEKMYDTTLGLTNFRAEANDLVRILGMRAGDTFATTAFTGTLVKGDQVILGTNGVLVKGTPTGTENFIGVVDKVLVLGLGYDKIPAVSIKVVKA